MTGLITALARPRMFVAATLFTALFASPRAFAQEPPPATPPPPPPVGGSLGVFGERGQFVVSSDLEFSLGRNSTSSAMGMPSSSEVFLTLTPALDYFVSTNFSVGGLLSLAYGSGDGGSATNIAIGGRAGYNIFLTNVVTLWIRGGLAYGHLSIDPDMGTSTSGNQLSLQIFAPVMWHPAPHFFIGVGPVFETQLMATFEGMDIGKDTTFGLASTVGGYWGGL